MKIPKENRPEWNTNVQWKGTDICMDFWCPDCDEYSHFDGFFAYAVECSSCHSIFQMPTDLPLVKVTREDADMVMTAAFDGEDHDE